MKSISVGIVCLLLFVLVTFSILPWEFLQLTHEVIFVLKGSIPLLIAVFGLFCLLVGFTDIADKKYAKKEAQLQKEFEEQNNS